MATLTNTQAAQAYRGQSVIITTTYELVQNLSIGQSVTNNSDKKGYISEIDFFGNSFKITPNMPSDRFDTAASPGILASGAVITY